MTPQHGKGGTDCDKTIARHRIDMMMTLFCDFLQMGHEVRGTNKLAVTKVDIVLFCDRGLAARDCVRHESLCDVPRGD